MKTYKNWSGTEENISGAGDIKSNKHLCYAIVYRFEFLLEHDNKIYFSRQSLLFIYLGGRVKMTHIYFYDNKYFKEINFGFDTVIQLILLFTDFNPIKTVWGGEGKFVLHISSSSDDISLDTEFELLCCL